VNTSITRRDTPELRARTAARTDALSRLSGSLGTLDTLPDVTRQIVQNAFSSRRSNLRSQQEKRRVAGSSFANQELSSLASEQAVVESQAQRQSILEKVAASSKVISQREDLLRQQVAEEFQLLNIATGNTDSVTNAISAQAALDKKLDAIKIQGEGEFYGALGESLINPLSKAGLQSSSAGGSGLNSQALLRILLGGEP